MPGAVPLPAARPPERAARVPRPVCPGCGRCGRVDPAPAPQRAPLRAGVARCGGGGRASPGGAVLHRCEGRLVPGAVPPPAARPPERAARVPRSACPGCGRCGRGGPAPAPQRAPLRAGVARCGGGGRASPGGVPSTMVRGAWGQALSLSRLPAHCRVGCRGSLGVCGVCGACAVRVVVRGAALSLVLRCSPLRCLGAVLCSPCARRVPSSVCFNRGSRSVAILYCSKTWSGRAVMKRSSKAVRRFARAALTTHRPSQPMILRPILVILRAPSQMEYAIRHMVVFNSKAYANI